jgi:hypothetical protein
MSQVLTKTENFFDTKRYRKLNPFQCVSSKVYFYTNKPSKVLFALTKLLMTDEVTRIDGSGIAPSRTHRRYAHL